MFCFVCGLPMRRKSFGVFVCNQCDNEQTEDDYNKW